LFLTLKIETKEYKVILNPAYGGINSAKRSEESIGKNRWILHPGKERRGEE
jgi:hypothetical protein